MNLENEGKNHFSLNWKLAIKKPKLFLKDLYPFILSHHPDCVYFKDHYFSVKGVKLCVGCFTAYPTFLFVFLSGYFFKVFSFLSFRTSLIVSLLLVLPYVIYRFERFHHSKKFNVLAKASFAVAFAILFNALLNAPVPSWYSWLLIILIGGLVNSVFNALRAFKMEKVCKSCPMYSEFPRCDGFIEIIEKLERDGFLNAKNIDKGEEKKQEDVA